MKVLLLSLFVLALSLPINAQTQVGDASLPNTMKVGGEELVLNGAGIREKFFFDLYSGGLYLTEKSSDAAAISNADKAMAIKLHITSKLISSKKMIDAVNEGFEKATNDNTTPIADEIAKFKDFFSEEIEKKDVFDITYQPGKGVVAYKNGNEKGTINNMVFKKALFDIWLGEDPADDDLKEAMLGK